MNFIEREGPSSKVTKVDKYELSTSNSLDTIIHNDIVLACQWRDMHTSRELSPEARLCLGVLRQALMDIAQPTSPIKSVREARAQDALAWLAGGPGYITLEHVCGALRIGDVRGFSQRLLRAIAKHEAKRSVAASTLDNLSARE
jgi:hypothetical protein